MRYWPYFFGRPGDPSLPLVRLFFLGSLGSGVSVSILRWNLFRRDWIAIPHRAPRRFASSSGRSSPIHRHASLKLVSRSHLFSKSTTGFFRRPARECKPAMQFSFMQGFQRLLAVNVIVAAVPNHHRAAAVLTFRNYSFESRVFEWMILHFDGKMFFPLRPG